MHTRVCVQCTRGNFVYFYRRARFQWRTYLRVVFKFQNNSMRLGQVKTLKNPIVFGSRNTRAKPLS